MQKLIMTEDGSTTLFVESLNEHYHSTFGAIQESLHIFIEAGLKNQLKRKKQIKILEIGFGTGLNALLTYKEARIKDVLINYCGIEAFPVKPTLIKQLNFGEILKDDLLNEKFKILHQIEWGQIFDLDTNFKIQKLHQRIELTELDDNQFDLVYFDAFAPDIQPELWTELIFDNIYKCMVPEGILVTYSVKGDVKRALKSVGFEIEKLPGPKGKREILRAIKPIQP